MSPLAATLIIEGIPAIAGAGIAIVATSFLMRGHETRLQHVEHEIADLRAALNLAPSTTEVSKRYDVIQGYAQRGDHTAALADSMRQDKAS